MHYNAIFHLLLPTEKTIQYSGIFQNVVTIDDLFWAVAGATIRKMMQKIDRPSQAGLFSLQTILVSFVLFLLPSYHEAADRGTLGGGDVAVVNAASLAEVVVGDAGENEGAKPHVFRAVCPFVIMCWNGHLFNVIIFFSWERSLSFAPPIQNVFLEGIDVFLLAFTVTVAWL